jgi:hypothetical protein
MGESERRLGPENFFSYEGLPFALPLECDGSGIFLIAIGSKALGEPKPCAGCRNCSGSNPENKRV